MLCDFSNLVHRDHRSKLPRLSRLRAVAEVFPNTTFIQPYKIKLKLKIWNLILISGDLGETGKSGVSLLCDFSNLVHRDHRSKLPLLSRLRAVAEVFSNTTLQTTFLRV